MPLLNASMPANAAGFFNEIANVAAFDIFEIGEYVDKYLQLEGKESVNEKFESIGFETVYFINNMGTFIFWLLAYYLSCVLWSLAQITSKFSEISYRFSRYLGAKLFWNSAISTVLESFLIVALASMISLRHNYEYGSAGQTI